MGTPSCEKEVSARDAQTSRTRERLTSSYGAQQTLICSNNCVLKRSRRRCDCLRIALRLCLLCCVQSAQARRHRASSWSAASKSLFFFLYDSFFRYGPGTPGWEPGWYRTFYSRTFFPLSFLLSSFSFFSSLFLPRANQLVKRIATLARRAAMSAVASSGFAAATPHASTATARLKYCAFRPNTRQLRFPLANLCSVYLMRPTYLRNRNREGGAFAICVRARKCERKRMV